MWWSKPGILSVLVVVLAACADFRPLHRTDNDNALNRQLASIDIAPARSRSMQQLRGLLLDRLDPANRAETKDFRLDIRLQRRRKSLAVQLDDSVTRYDMVLTATATLVDLGSEKSVYRTKISRRASYNVLREPFATLVAERDAERRAAIEIANQLRVVLSLFFERESSRVSLTEEP